MNQEQIDVAMQGIPRVNEEFKQVEITLTESVAFKVRKFIKKIIGLRSTFFTVKVVINGFALNGNYLKKFSSVYLI